MEREETVQLKEESKGTSSLSQRSLGEPCLSKLCGFFSELKTPAFLFRTEGVSALMLTSFFGSSCPDLLIFEIVLKMDNVPFICPSTESDII